MKRNRSRFSLCLALFWFLAAHCSGQDAAKEPDTQSKQFSERVTAIKMGSFTAIEEAGNSGDQRYRPVLREVEQGRNAKNEGVLPYTHRALAKLDSPYELGTILCSMRSGGNVQQYEQSLQFRAIGGWATIRTLYDLLKNEGSNRKSEWTNGGEVEFPSATQLAIEVLAKILPAGPGGTPKDILSPTTEQISDIAGRWQQWIRDHEPELIMLKLTCPLISHSSEYES